jgi:hypothetical protein
MCCSIEVKFNAMSISMGLSFPPKKEEVEDQSSLFCRAIVRLDDNTIKPFYFVNDVAAKCARPFVLGSFFRVSLHIWRVSVRSVYLKGRMPMSLNCIKIRLLCKNFLHMNTLAYFASASVLG